MPAGTGPRVRILTSHRAAQRPSVDQQRIVLHAAHWRQAGAAAVALDDTDAPAAAQARPRRGPRARSRAAQASPTHVFSLETLAAPAMLTPPTASQCMMMATRRRHALHRCVPGAPACGGGERLFGSRGGKREEPQGEERCRRGVEIGQQARETRARLEEERWDAAVAAAARSGAAAAHTHGRTCHDMPTRVHATQTCHYPSPHMQATPNPDHPPTPTRATR